ncbi:hypothetical protein CTAYLR_001087, partial [Chrysophaeum taylorii]
MAEEAAPWIKLRWYQWALLGMIDVLGPCSSDSYIPNLPAMQKNLGAGEVKAELSLQLNWLAKGLATDGAVPCWGVRVLHRRDRGMRVDAELAAGIYSLLFFRFVQGIGEACTTVSTAIARDVLVDPKERLRVLALLGSLRPAAIMLAPSVGGAVGQAVGWRAVFAGLAVAGVLCAAAAFLSLPETVHLQPRTDDPSERSFVAVLSRLGSRGYEGALGAMLLNGISAAGLWAYLSNVAPLLETRFGVSVLATALIMGSVAMVFVLVNALIYGIVRIRGDCEPLGLLKISTFSHALFAALSLTCALGPIPRLRDSVDAAIPVVYVFAASRALCIGAATTVFIQPFGDAAGRASAVILVFRTIVSTALAQLSTDVTARYGVRGFYCSWASKTSSSPDRKLASHMARHVSLCWLDPGRTGSGVAERGLGGVGSALGFAGLVDLRRSYARATRTSDWTAARAAHPLVELAAGVCVTVGSSHCASFTHSSSPLVSQRLVMASTRTVTMQSVSPASHPAPVICGFCPSHACAFSSKASRGSNSSGTTSPSYVTSNTSADVVNVARVAIAIRELMGYYFGGIYTKFPDFIGVEEAAEVLCCRFSAKALKDFKPEGPETFAATAVGVPRDEAVPKVCALCFVVLWPKVAVCKRLSEISYEAEAIRFGRRERANPGRLGEKRWRYSHKGSAFVIDQQQRLVTWWRCEDTEDELPANVTQVAGPGSPLSWWWTRRRSHRANDPRGTTTTTTTTTSSRLAVAYECIAREFVGVAAAEVSGASATVTLIEMSDRATVVARDARSTRVCDFLRKRAEDPPQARARGRYLPALDAAVETLASHAATKDQFFLLFLSDGAPSDHKSLSCLDHGVQVWQSAC